VSRQTPRARPGGASALKLAPAIEAPIVGTAPAPEPVPDSVSPAVTDPVETEAPESRAPEVRKSGSTGPTRSGGSAARRSGTTDARKSGGSATRSRRSPAAPEPDTDGPRYLTLIRKEARLRGDQVDQLAQLRRHLSRRRANRDEVLTDNTLIRVAVDLLLHHADELRGDSEQELLDSVVSE
jgi:hypothetical protein